MARGAAAWHAMGAACASTVSATGLSGYKLVIEGQRVYRGAPSNVDPTNLARPSTVASNRATHSSQVLLNLPDLSATTISAGGPQPARDAAAVR